jgi:thiamine biosynthesis lipoprotein
MGTRYAAVYFSGEEHDAAGLQSELQQAVDRVDSQMSTWKPQSDLMRLNRAPVGRWIEVPEALGTVLAAGLEVGRLSDGAFDIGVGELVTAWGFGPAAGHVDRAAIAAAGARQRPPAHLALELDRGRSCVRKHAALSLDLCGIAKGFGVDELARVLGRRGIASYLVSIDGEVRAGMAKPDGSPWRVAVERPESGHRAAAGVIALAEGALATSGDYRHRLAYGGTTYAHTMDPHRGAPLAGGPAAVTVRANDCMSADAWATALMVLGPEQGVPLATAFGLEVLFAERADVDAPARRGSQATDHEGPSRPDCP